MINRVLSEVKPTKTIVAYAGDRQKLSSDVLYLPWENMSDQDWIQV